MSEWLRSGLTIYELSDDNATNRWWANIYGKPLVTTREELEVVARKLQAADKLLTALQKLLAYHVWAKNPGQWDNEPEDPQAECEAVLKEVGEI
jgi:hypothetical protein